MPERTPKQRRSAEAHALAANAASGGLLHELVYGPQVYLYWSTLHVLQTVRSRGTARSSPGTPFHAEIHPRGPAEEPST